jgi:gamma-glutamyltranspeptidase/glutathione hydrolase
MIRTAYLTAKMSIIFMLSFIYSTQLLHAQIGLTNEAKNAMVVSASKEASEAGLAIIKKGGNAIDAAVATHMALAVTFPQAGNIGGGGFMVYKPANEAAVALDFREKAPSSASRNMYIDKDGNYVSEASKIGPLAAGVPGSVAGLWEAHQKYGKLPWKEVLAPAIKLAREGFPLSYHEMNSLNNYRYRFTNFPSTLAIFSPKSDTVFKEGELFTQTDLANTLERIATNGRDGFYKGKTAELLVNYMKQNNGLISSEDLVNYQAVWRPILETTFAGYTLHLMPPTSSGGVAIAQMLGMLNADKLVEAGFLSADYLHQLAEAMRRAFADRSAYLGDPDFYEVPQKELLAKNYLEKRWASFDLSTASKSSELAEGKPINESTETTHYSVIDSEGNAVAITTTLNGLYGNQMVVKGAGFFLNNEMDDFSAQPGVPNMFGLIGGEANSIAPNKRMLSSMIPTIVSDENGKVRMILGAAGGPRIINTVLQTFLASALFNLPAQRAVAAPRIHHQWFPDRLYVERYSLGSDTRNLLRVKGHRLADISSIARSHLIFVNDEGIIEAGVDPRGRGASAGY